MKLNWKLSSDSVLIAFDQRYLVHREVEFVSKTVDLGLAEEFEPRIARSPGAQHKLRIAALSTHQAHTA